MEVVSIKREAATLDKGQERQPVLDTIQGNCTPGVLWVSLRRGGEERNCINIGFCLNAHVPAPLHQLGEPSWRMKNAALASEKKTPGHALMRGGGVTADRKIKLSAGALRPRARPELVDWAARPLPLGSPNSVAVSCCILEDRSLPLWLALYGTINEQCSDSRHLSILFRAWACDQTIRHCPPGSTEKCLLSSL